MFSLGILARAWGQCVLHGALLYAVTPKLDSNRTTWDTSHLNAAGNEIAGPLMKQVSRLEQ